MLVLVALAAAALAFAAGWLLANWLARRRLIDRVMRVAERADQLERRLARHGAGLGIGA
jgi:hypothetical protein